MIGRIHDRDAFQRLRREGTRIRIDPLWCSFLPDPSLSSPRVAFAFGRGAGNAVARNRLRRRLRALLDAAGLPPGLLLVGANTPAAVELTFADLQRRIEALVVEISRATT